MVAIAIALPFAPQATQVLHSGGFVSLDFESEQAITLLAQKLHFDPTIVQVIFTSQRYSADSPAFTQEAQQALTRVLGWSEVSGAISFTDNPLQISLDRHAAYANVLLKADPDNAPKLLPEPATMRLLGNLNWWLPFAGVQRHPPALAEYMGEGESEIDTAQATEDELLKDAHVGGKQ
jgi:hypothetical protein